MKHVLEPLPYSFDALEPHIDAKTMEIHHGKHHQTYVDKLNAALEKHPNLQEKKIEELLSQLNAVPEDIRSAVRNHGGGHFNHSFWWPLLKKEVKPNGEVLEAIKSSFESLDKFKEKFTAAGMNNFGSGWAWLVLTKEGSLEIMSTPNQDSPISQGKMPIVGVDLWEHSFYIKFQNRKNEYLAAFWNVVNWDQVEKNYQSARKRAH
jgi:superoxide dismutase, Fe-Mn family